MEKTTNPVGVNSGDVLAQLSGVHKRFGNLTALSGLDLQIRRGELLALLGPNGAGKSTAIALLLGLQEPTSGAAQLFGKSPREIDARRRIGVMMQEVGLNPVLRGRELVDLVASYYPNAMSVEQALTLSGNTSLADRPYGKLSGGQKRQVQFAMAICGRPQLLFLDEPTVGLDVEARETMWRTVRKLVDLGTSVLLTTHYLEEAEALASRVTVIAKGVAVANGTVSEMRALVARKRISCISRVAATEVATWAGVQSAALEGDHLQIVAGDADAVIHRLVHADSSMHDIEVRRAGLAEAFTELTREATP